MPQMIEVDENEYTELVLGREEDQRRIQELEYERTELIKALKWYADDDHWITPFDQHGNSGRMSVEYDRGQIAKNALEEYNPPATGPGKRTSAERTQDEHQTDRLV